MYPCSNGIVLAARVCVCVCACVCGVCVCLCVWCMCVFVCACACVWCMCVWCLCVWCMCVWCMCVFVCACVCVCVCGVCVCGVYVCLCVRVCVVYVRVCVCGVCVCGVYVQCVCMFKSQCVFLLNYTDEIESAQIKVQVLRDPGYTTHRVGVSFCVCVCVCVSCEIHLAMQFTPAGNTVMPPPPSIVIYPMISLTYIARVIGLFVFFIEYPRSARRNQKTNVERPLVHTHICTHTLHDDLH